jgi:hypothetical protein
MTAWQGGIRAWAAALAAALLLAGCASTPFLEDRRADAGDILTATIGAGVGAKLRVGPIQAAAIRNADLLGWRAGQWLADGNSLVDNDEFYLPLPSGRRGAWGEKGALFGREAFSHGARSLSCDRGKDVRGRGPFPFVAVSDAPGYFTQVEIAGGALFTLRLGINFGELADFVAGWFGHDPYGDDLNAPP